MIRAGEISAPSPTVPYYRRRIAELVAEGRAAMREGRAGPSGRTREEIAAQRRMAAARRLSYRFAARLALVQDGLDVYLVAARLDLSFRRANPKPALNGKVYVPPLPAGAVHLGRFAYPHSRREFLRELVHAIEDASK